MRSGNPIRRMGHTQSSLLDMIGYTNDLTVGDDSMSEERRTITDTLFCIHSVDNDLNTIGFTANITQTPDEWWSFRGTLHSRRAVMYSTNSKDTPLVVIQF